MLVVCSVYTANANSGSSEQGGFGGGFGPTGAGCSCGSSARSNPCRNNTGTINIGCSRSNKYVQCTDTTCTAQTCPTGQVWNTTLKSCAACQPGYHVAANNRTCVCNLGTTPTGPFTCGTCPTAATINPDSCSCTSPLVLNKAANACQACPTNSVVRGDDCSCSTQLFWNEAAWACQPCPGTWVSSGSGRRVTQECRCNDTTQVFDERTVSCVSCPAGTTADDDGDSCDCPIRGQYYNTTTQACQCPRSTQLNTAGTACQWGVPAPVPAGRR
jgi:hypothetical protein